MKALDQAIDRAVTSPASFDLDAQMSVYCPLQKTVESSGSIKELFARLTGKLDKFFSIHRGSYSLYVPERQTMKVPVVWEDHEVKSGIVINVAASQSLMRNVLQNGTIFVEDFPSHFKGNIVEKKLLLADDSNSLSVIPLLHRSEQIGTLNYASAAPFAFSVFSSHLFDYLFKMVSERFHALQR
jgi:hypothetical protein